MARTISTPRKIPPTDLVLVPPTIDKSPKQKKRKTKTGNKSTVGNGNGKKKPKAVEAAKTSQGHREKGTATASIQKNVTVTNCDEGLKNCAVHGDQGSNNRRTDATNTDTQNPPIVKVAMTSVVKISSSKGALEERHRHHHHLIGGRNGSKTEIRMSEDEDGDREELRWSKGGQNRGIKMAPSTKRRNIRNHGEVKPFKCPHPGCSSSFLTRGNLKVHSRIHSGDKPYGCLHPGCGRAFSKSSNLRDHSRIHSGERPYACPHPGCGKAFTQRANLNGHSKIHAGDKPYACLFPGCGKAFRRNGHLKDHSMIHSGEKPFACPFPGCGKIFNRKSHVTSHRKIHDRHPNPLLEALTLKLDLN